MKTKIASDVENRAEKKIENKSESGLDSKRENQAKISGKKITEQTKNCLIVQCKFSEFSYWNYTEVCNVAGAKYPTAPLGLLTMAALLPKKWNYKLIDENVEELTDEHYAWADIICTGGMLSQQTGMLSVIKKAREINKTVVVGGPGPTSQPYVYEDADFLVCGEGEVTIAPFLEDLKNGATKGVYQSSELADMTQAVVPRYDLIQFNDYLNVGVQYSRGCPFNCEFCDIIELYGRKPRMKTSEQVLIELETLYNLGYRGHVDFVDDNFIGNKAKVKETLVEIYKWSQKRKFPFFFSTEASINMADDEELLTLMQRVDFRFVFVGIETPDDNLLKEMGKKQNVNKPIVTMINKILEYGMVVNGGFIMGFDCETKHTAENMITLIEDSGIVLAMLGLLYALPNTQLTRRLQKEGRMPKEDGYRTDAVDQMISGLNFRTQRPKKEILEDYMHVIKHIYSAKNYFKRVESVAANLKLQVKYKPDLKTVIRSLVSLWRITRKLGFNRDSGLLYWKTLIRVTFKNPKGFEMAMNLAAMYIHFRKQSKYLIDLTDQKIVLESNMSSDTVSYASAGVNGSNKTKIA